MGETKAELPMADEPRCDTCRFWKPWSETEGARDGQCRRLPPVLPPTAKHVREADAASADDSLRSGWFPDTEPYYWCGEYRARAPVPLAKRSGEAEARLQVRERQWQGALRRVALMREALIRAGVTDPAVLGPPLIVIENAELIAGHTYAWEWPTEPSEENRTDEPDRNGPRPDQPPQPPGPAVPG